MADKQVGDLPLESGPASVNAEPLTLSEGIDALTDLLGGDDPETDLGAAGSKSNAKPATPTKQKPSEELVQKADDLDFWGEEEEQGEGADEAEAGEGPEAEVEEEADEEEDEAEGFVLSDDTEIDLGNGHKATLAALKADYGQVRKREADMQRHFTQAMQKVSEEKQVVSREADRVVQYAQDVRRQRELIEAHARRFMPQPPQRPQHTPQQDPVGWMEYRAQKDEYDDYMSSLEAIRQEDEVAARRQQEAQAADLPKVLDKQRELLLTRYPRLRNPELASKTMQEMVKVFSEHYAFSPQEIMQVKDARLISAMLDATAFHRVKARKPEVEKVLKSKPPVMKSGKRMDASDQRKWGDKAKLKRLAETGSLDAAADVLADLI
jgi:hypothetical protein